MSSAPSSVRLVEGAARRFGEIDLIARLGQGGMAEVFLAARRAKPAELLVLKRLKEDLDDPEHRSMFDDEARIMPLFNHPNIVRTVAAGEEDGRKYLAMEFLDGLPLDQCLEAIGALGRRAALHVVCELLEGLHYAHELHGREGELLDLVHRDVSPHNVFITYEGRVTLVDFGIAKSKAKANHTATGVVRGKLSYMAPEQALCDTVDRRADVFSAGVILWELLAGRRFWEGLSDVQILKRMTFGELPGIADAQPDIPDDVRSVLDKALAVKPEDRYATARAFREALITLVDAPFKRLELGRAVAEAASGYREALQGVVSSHLERARGTDGLFGPAASLEEPPESSDAGGLDRPSSAGAAGAPPSAQPLSGAAEVVPEEASVQPAELAVPAEPLLTTHTAVTRPTDPAPARRSGVVLALVAAGLGIAAFFGLRNATTGSAVPAQPPGLAASPAAVELQVEVATQNARASLDGAPITLPFKHRYAKSDAQHRLVVEADGYLPRTQVIVLDRDVALAIALEPAAPKGDAGVPSAPATSSAPPVVTAGPRTTGRPQSPATSTAPPVKPTTSGFDYRTNPWDTTAKPR